MSKVFGIGMFKTGTTSLGKALELLGFETFHGPWREPDVVPFKPWGVDLTEMREYRHVIRELVDRHDAFQDYPFMYLYPLLDEWYPGSKYILTTREPMSLAVSDQNMWRKLNIGDGDVPPVEQFIERYEKHYANVVSYFTNRPDDLLIVNWAEGHGWPELCQFLGMKTPDAPFPRANTGAYTIRAKLSRKFFRLVRRLGFPIRS